MEALNEILAVLNSWAEADLAKIRAIRDDLKAQVLHRMPPVIPRRQYGQRQRAMRTNADPHPKGWGHEGR